MKNKSLNTVLGIDGCHGGWCVVKHDSLGNSSLHLIKSIDEILMWNVDIAIIDIPIGLSDSREERGFDKFAKEQLKNKASSVFPVPCYSAVYAENGSYENACEINKKVTGKKISRQSYAIIPKIREVDEFLQEHPNMRKYLFENHPEVCFAMMRDNKPCVYHKRTRAGEDERLPILKEHIDIFNLLHNPPYFTNDVEAKRDDIIDAAILAVTGLSIIKNKKGAD